MSRIGIFGGSFNPVHRGHLKLAECALSELNLDRVIFVPSYRTPLKAGRDFLPSALRLRLLKAAVKKHPRFSVSDCEMRRRGASFTVDTLRYFKKKFGPRCTLYFLAGADTLADLPHWKSLEEIFRLCRFVVFTRPGIKVQKVPPTVLWVPFDAPDISASGLRRRLRENRRAEALLPAGTVEPLRGYFKKDRFNGKEHKRSSRPRR